MRNAEVSDAATISKAQAICYIGSASISIYQKNFVIFD